MTLTRGIAPWDGEDVDERRDPTHARELDSGAAGTLALGRPARARDVGAAGRARGHR